MTDNEMQKRNRVRQELKVDDDRLGRRPYSGEVVSTLFEQAQQLARSLGIAQFLLFV